MANIQGARNKPVLQPFLGLFFDQEPWQLDPRAFVDCNNIRIYLGTVTSEAMGWSSQTAQIFDDQITMVTAFPFSIGLYQPIVGTAKDIYTFKPGAGWGFITPIYHTGSVTVAGTAVIGVGTLWNTSIGGAFRNNVVPGDQMYFGSSNQVDPNVTWYEVASVQDDTHLTLATGAPVFGPAGAYTSRQRFFGDADNYHWEWEVFPAAGEPWNSDMFFATNGADALFAWNGTQASGQYVNSMPFTAFQLRRFKNLMIYGGLVQDGELLPTSIANSDNGKPTNMIDGAANQYIVADGPFQINNLEPLGNTLMIYMGSVTGGDVVSAQFVGGALNFVFTEVIRGRGPLGSRLVAAFPDRHQFLSTDGEYRYNGLYVQLMNTHIWKKALQTFDLSRANRSFCFVNKQYGEIYWALPYTTDPGEPLTTALVEHYLEQQSSLLFKPFTKRDFPFSAAGFQPDQNITTWDELVAEWQTYTQLRWNTAFSITGSFAPTIMGDNNGRLWKLNDSNLQATDPFTSFVTLGRRITGNERSRDLITRIYPYAQMANIQLTVILEMYNAVGAGAAIVDTKTFDCTYAGNRFTDHFRCGRLFQVTFKSILEANTGWSIGGYDIDLQPGGLR